MKHRQTGSSFSKDCFEMFAFSLQQQPFFRSLLSYQCKGPLRNPGRPLDVREEGKVSSQHGLTSRKAMRQTQVSLQKKRGKYIFFLIKKNLRNSHLHCNTLKMKVKDLKTVLHKKHIFLYKKQRVTSVQQQLSCCTMKLTDE